MISSPYLRYILVLLSFIPMWFLNVIFNILYFITGTNNLIRNKRIPFLIWFLNTDEPTEVENNYGDNKNREKWGILDIKDRNIFIKFIYFCHWNIFRNSFFYYRQHVINPLKYVSKVDKVIKNTTGKDNLHICNCSDNGTIHIIEERSDKKVKYFRYSFTKPFLFWRLNIQLGVNGIDESNRHLIDLKFCKK